MIRYLPLLLIGSLFLGCNSKHATENYASETLQIQQVADHVYQHISFLDTESFGKVACNGMIVFNQHEAIIFDTPNDDATSLELINWVENQLDCTIKAIIPTHFHTDCLGGLAEFHNRGIPSYANNATITLAKARSNPLPQNGFDQKLTLEVGGKKVIAQFFGEGHTHDNVIGYFPDEEVLFGGCLIKALAASEGNLEDANIKAWPVTVGSLKEKYPSTKTVIPGHGESGGTALLDYTIRLFEQKK